MNLHASISSAPLATVADQFVSAARAKQLTIGVLGLGYVGLPLAQAMVRKGFTVLGFDTDDHKVETLGERKSYIKHISDASVGFLLDSGRFSATSDFSRLGEPDAVVICVPTPLDDHRNPDLSYVAASTEAVAKTLRPGQLVVLESTTYPGTCEEIMVPILERSGLRVGVDFGIAYSPEREDPGNQSFETATIPKVVGANTDAERAMAVALYAEVVSEVVPVADLKTAEAVKLVENIFRHINIGLVNELKVVFHHMGIDVWEVIEAAKTKPFGFMPFYPGPGLGGHCIPIDPFYLSWRARAYGVNTRFIELAGEINTDMPRYVISRLTEELSLRQRKAVAGSRILLVGLAYKKNIDDMRESPSLDLLEQLEARHAEVDYYDPFVLKIPVTREHPEYNGRQSIEWSRESLQQYDAAIIATDHDDVDYRMLLECVPLVVDSRNATAPFAREFADRIVKA